MTDHAAALVAFIAAALSLLIASVAGGMHLAPRVDSPLSGTATAAVSTVFAVLASVLLVWGLLHLGFAHAH